MVRERWVIINKNNRCSAVVIFTADSGQDPIGMDARQVGKRPCAGAH